MSPSNSRRSGSITSRNIAAVFIAFVTALAANACRKCPDNYAVAGKNVQSSPAIPTQVNVLFQGSICHVFSTRNRSVVLKSRSDLGDYPHLAQLLVPTSINKSELDKATGISSVKIAGNYVVQPLDGLAIRVVDWDGTTATPLDGGALDYSLPEFDKMVPHLKTEVSNDTMTYLSDAAIVDDIPDQRDIAAFFELEGGKFTNVDPYCKDTKYKVDYKGLGMHKFAESVTFAGSAKTAIALQFSRQKGVWNTATFNASTGPVVLWIVNLPNPSEVTPVSHLMMFKRLAKSTPGTFDEIEPISCSDHGAIPGCSDSQWP